MFPIFCLGQGDVLVSFERFPFFFFKLLCDNSKLPISGTFHFKYLGKHVILLRTHFTSLEMIILNSK